MCVSYASAQKGKIAFVRDGNIWVMNADGSKQERITSSGLCSNPTWSPDGKKIAFSVQAKKDYYESAANIWVMDLNSRTATKLTKGQKDSNDSPSWSPDGKWIAFVNIPPLSPNIDYVEVPGWVEIIAPSGRKRQKVIEGCPGGSISWSPGSDKLALVMYSGEASELWSLSISGSSRKLYEEVEEDEYGNLYFDEIFNTKWSKDGKQIYFGEHKFRGRGSTIALLSGISLSNKQVKILLRLPDGSMNFDLSPDEKHIVYSKKKMDTEMEEIWLLNITEPSNPQKIADNAGQPAWQPVFK